MSDAKRARTLLKLLREREWTDDGLCPICLGWKDLYGHIASGVANEWLGRAKYKTEFGVRGVATAPCPAQSRIAQLEREIAEADKKHAPYPTCCKEHCFPEAGTDEKHAPLPMFYSYPAWWRDYDMRQGRCVTIPVKIRDYTIDDSNAERILHSHRIKMDMIVNDFRRRIEKLERDTK